MLIGGEQRSAAAKQELEVVNPATEEVVDTVPAATAEDVDAAVAAANGACADWSRTDVEKRASIVAAAADLIADRAKDIAPTLIAEALGEINHLVHGLHYYAEAATKVQGTYQELPSTFGPAYGMVIRRQI